MYIVYKVNCIFQDTDEIKIEIDNIFNKLGEARHYIHTFEYVICNGEKCVISNIVEDKPTDKSDDGYYLIKNNNIDNRVDIYKKKTTLVEGYLYNSYEIKIEKILFFEIKFFDTDNGVREACKSFTKEVRPNLNKPYILPHDLLSELKAKLACKAKIE